MRYMEMFLRILMSVVIFSNILIMRIMLDNGMIYVVDVCEVVWFLKLDK